MCAEPGVGLCNIMLPTVDQQQHSAYRALQFHILCYLAQSECNHNEELK